MTLEEQAGRLLIGGFEGLSISDHARALVTDLHAGGVVLFSSNVRDPEQVKTLADSLQGIAGGNLLIAADQEGGIVTRLHAPFTEFPGAMALGAAGDLSLTRSVAAAMGQEMRSVGINWDLAPVADLSFQNGGNPAISVRSFGDDPEQVAKQVTAFIQGLRDAGVAACVKHFPGIGDSAADPHKTMPIVRAEGGLLARRERPSFAAALAAGAAAVMPSHVWYPAYDPEDPLPATFSKAIMTDLLRGALGFHGVAVSDDLLMGGIAERSTPGHAAVRALKAGCDMVMVCRDLEAQRETVAAIAEAVCSGELPRARFEEAVGRVADLQQKAAQTMRAAGEHAEGHQDLACKVALMAATLLQGDPAAFMQKCRISPVAVVYPERLALTGVEDGRGPVCVLSDELRKQNARVTCLTYGADPEPEDVERILGMIPRDALVFLCTVNAHRNREQRDFLGVLANRILHEHLCLVALRDPQDALLVDRSVCAIALYDQLPVSQLALARRLVTGMPFQGSCPVAMEH